MTTLELADIQGNIYRPYGRFGFPFTRHLFFHIADAAAGRAFVDAVRARVTTAEPWDASEDASGTRIVAKPPVTLNIGFSFMGLHALELPTRTLRLMPDEFVDGMGCRAAILGDAGGSAPAEWDPIWREPEHPVHIWISLNVGANPDGTPLPALDEWTAWLEGLAVDAVTLVGGHGADGAGRWQDSAAIMETLPDGTRRPAAREHFGFTDGISDPVFRGQFDDPAAEKLAAIGGGKLATGTYDAAKSWSPLEAGEFILGQPDEGQQLPVATQPAMFARNGTFMVWRKLKQDVAAWDTDMAAKAALWQAVNPGTTVEEAGETIRAKIVGRWRNGIPLVAAPTWADYRGLDDEYAACIAIALRKPRDSTEAQRLAKFNLLMTGFRYGEDREGAKCPLGAHIRRANPRDMLDPKLSATVGASTLTNRRRILRRGLPYEDAGGEKGIVFMAICSSLFRQFEFIQQQWMNYGLDFDAGNDACPLIGSRTMSDKHVIPAGADTAPFIASGLPEFVQTRGGEYFFLPSLTALRMIAMGTVDPT
ncbi:MAG: Dyp-type peroxidase [Janthinobacterium lividum]